MRIRLVILLSADSHLCVCMCVPMYVCLLATDSVVTRKSNKKSLLDLPNLFSKYCFFLYGDFTDSYRNMIIRYITAYDG